VRPRCRWLMATLKSSPRKNFCAIRRD